MSKLALNLNGAKRSIKALSPKADFLLCGLCGEYDVSFNHKGKNIREFVDSPKGQIQQMRVHSIVCYANM